MLSQKLTVVYLIISSGRVPALPTSGTDLSRDALQQSTPKPSFTTIDYDLADFDEFANDPSLYDNVWGSAPSNGNQADDMDQGYAFQPGGEKTGSFLSGPNKKGVAGTTRAPPSSGEISGEDFDHTNMREYGDLNKPSNKVGATERENGNLVIGQNKTNIRNANGNESGGGRSGRENSSRRGNVVTRTFTKGSHQSGQNSRPSYAGTNGLTPFTSAEDTSNSVDNSLPISAQVRTHISESVSLAPLSGGQEEFSDADMYSSFSGQKSQNPSPTSRNSDQDKIQGNNDKQTGTSDQNTESDISVSNNELRSTESEDDVTGSDISRINSSDMNDHDSSTKIVDDDSFTSADSETSSWLKRSQHTLAEGTVADVSKHYDQQSKDVDQDTDQDFDKDNSNTASQNQMAGETNGNSSEISNNWQNDLDSKASIEDDVMYRETSGSGEIEAKDNLKTSQDVSDCFRNNTNNSKSCGLLRALYSICKVQFHEECFEGVRNNRRNSLRASADISRDNYNGLMEDSQEEDGDSMVSVDSRLSASSITWSTESVESLSASFERASSIWQVISLIQKICPDICWLADNDQGSTTAAQKSNLSDLDSRMNDKGSKAIYDSNESADEDDLDPFTYDVRHSDEDLTMSFSDSNENLYSDNTLGLHSAESKEEASFESQDTALVQVISSGKDVSSENSPGAVSKTDNGYIVSEKSVADWSVEESHGQSDNTNKR